MEAISTFDIFKMTKGEQNKGVSVSFRFVTHNARQEQPDKAVDWPWKDRKGVRIGSQAPKSGFRY